MKRQIGLVMALAFLGCDEGALHVGEAQDELSVKSTFISDNAVPKEHCRVQSGRLNPNGNVQDGTKWRAGTQLLLFRNGTLRGMCTVDSMGHGGGAAEIRVSYDTLKQRVWQPGQDPNAVPNLIGGVVARDAHSNNSAPPVVGSPTESLGDLEASTNVAREYLSYGGQPEFVQVGYLAPHPWENPVPNGLGRAYQGWKDVLQSSWPFFDLYWTVGMQGNDGDFMDDPDDPNVKIGNTARFHITATEISRLSFPRIGQWMTEGTLKYAVAFHGTGRPQPNQGCPLGVKVGGGLGTDTAGDKMIFRRGIAENIRMLVDASHNGAMWDPNQVQHTNGSCDNNFDGDDTDNIVNQVARYQNGQGATIYRGIQLETGVDVDAVTYGKIGRAVHEVFDCLYDVIEKSSVGPGKLQSNGATYTNGSCRGFVTQFTLGADANRTWKGGLQTCQNGAHAHVDVYRRDELHETWDRIGGDDITYQLVNQQCVASLTQIPVNASGTGAGTYKVVVYGHSGSVFTNGTAKPVFAEVVD